MVNIKIPLSVLFSSIMALKTSPMTFSRIVLLNKNSIDLDLLPKLFVLSLQCPKGLTFGREKKKAFGTLIISINFPIKKNSPI